MGSCGARFHAATRAAVVLQANPRRQERLVGHHLTRVPRGTTGASALDVTQNVTCILRSGRSAIFLTNPTSGLGIGWPSVTSFATGRAVCDLKSSLCICGLTQFHPNQK